MTWSTAGPSDVRPTSVSQFARYADALPSEAVLRRQHEIGVVAGLRSAATSARAITRWPPSTNGGLDVTTATVLTAPVRASPARRGSGCRWPPLVNSGYKAAATPRDVDIPRPGALVRERRAAAAAPAPLFARREVLQTRRVRRPQDATVIGACAAIERSAAASSQHRRS